MAEHEDAERAQFTRMADARPEEWMIIGRSMLPYQQQLADRVLAHLGPDNSRFGQLPRVVVPTVRCDDRLNPRRLSASTKMPIAVRRLHEE